MHTNGFEGYYLKHQNATMTLALIPGCAADGAFLQVVADGRAWNVPFAAEEYQRANPVWLGKNRFSLAGVHLDVEHGDLRLQGTLRYRGITPPLYDVMGPLAVLPLECRHTVLSMRHRLYGKLNLNGTELGFTGGQGYIEGDSGHSFPKSYSWVQSNAFGLEKECSVFASAARIPFAGAEFWGCVALVWYRGREYRIASYLGGHIEHRSRGLLRLCQGGRMLEVEMQPRTGHALAAPQKGTMARTIHESPSGAARFRFWEGGKKLFDLHSTMASYEFVE